MDSMTKEYFDFLSDVITNTMKMIDSANEDDNRDISWTIVGVDFRSKKIIDHYGEEVYNIANHEVPGKKVSGSRIIKRNFNGSKRQLGSLIHEWVSASPIIDLQLFIDGLNAKGIPSYIDYENNIFHYNAKQIELKK